MASQGRMGWSSAHVVIMTTALGVLAVAAAAGMYAYGVLLGQSQGEQFDIVECVAMCNPCAAGQYEFCTEQQFQDWINDEWFKDNVVCDIQPSDDPIAEFCRQNRDAFIQAYWNTSPIEMGCLVLNPAACENTTYGTTSGTTGGGGSSAPGGGSSAPGGGSSAANSAASNGGNSSAEICFLIVYACQCDADGDGIAGEMCEWGACEESPDNCSGGTSSRMRTSAGSSAPASSAASSGVSSRASSRASSGGSSASRCGYSPVDTSMICCPAVPGDPVYDYGIRDPSLNDLQTDPNIYHNPQTGSPLCMEYVLNSMDANCNAISGPDQSIVEYLESRCPQPPTSAGKSSGGSKGSHGSGGSAASSRMSSGGSSALSSGGSSSVRSSAGSTVGNGGASSGGPLNLPRSSAFSRPSSDRSSAPFFCTADSQCPLGTYCNGGTCENGCRSNGDCAAGLCVNHECRPCADDDECATGNICRNGQCTAAASSRSSSRSSVSSAFSAPFFCTADSQCPLGTYCNGGTCENGCRSNGDCAAGLCVNHECRPCADDDECATGNICRNGQCTAAVSSRSSRSSARSAVVPIGGICVGNECARGGDLFCSANGASCLAVGGFPCVVCVPGAVSSAAVSSVPFALPVPASSAARSSVAPVLSVEPAVPVLGCRDEHDCSPGAACVSGSCNPCTGNEQCRSGICRGGRCADLSCATHADCAPGERCVQGACLASVQIASQPSFCGNARIDPGEECDDGVQNSNLTNALCRRDCRPGRCGDGVLDTPLERCDDGNTLAGDGCSPLCQTERAAPPEVRADRQTLPAQVIELPFQQPVHVAQQPAYQQADAYVAPVAPTPPATADTGPAALAVMAAGAAAGYGFIRRRR